ncbi:MAG: hypothetical protein AB8H79_20710 [Myxococcota bacterium]
MSAGLRQRVHRVHARIQRGGVQGRFVGVQHLCSQTHRVLGYQDGARIRGDGLAFEPGDLLYAAIRPEQNKVALARWSGVASPEILVLRPVEPHLRHALLLWLTHPHTTQVATQLARGNGRRRVRWADLADAMSHGPDDRSLGQLAGIASQIAARIDLLHARCAAHQALLCASAPAGQEGPRWGDVGTIQPPVPPGARADTKRPLIDVSCLRSAELSIGRWSARPPMGPHRRVREGDVLISRLRPALKKAAICPTEAVTTPELVPFRFAPMWRTAAMASLTQGHLWHRLVGAASGSQMPRVRLEHLQSIPIGLSAGRAQALHRQLGPVVEHLVRAPRYGRALHALRTQLAEPILSPWVRLTAPPVCRTSHTG